MVKDVFDGLKTVADGIKSIRTITEAVKSGKDYVKARHPEVQSDLRAMVNELRKSLLVIKQASSVLTNFRFAISTDSKGTTELSRFNEYFIQSKAEAQLLETGPNRVLGFRVDAELVPRDTHKSFRIGHFRRGAHRTPRKTSRSAPGLARSRRRTA